MRRPAAPSVTSDDGAGVELWVGGSIAAKGRSASNALARDVVEHICGPVVSDTTPEERVSAQSITTDQEQLGHDAAEHERAFMGRALGGDFF